MVTAAASDDEDAVTKPAIDPEVRAGQSRQALIYVSILQRFCCCRHGSQAVPAALRDADGTAGPRSDRFSSSAHYLKYHLQLLIALCAPRLTSSAEGLCCQSWSVARAASDVT